MCSFKYMNLIQYTISEPRRNNNNSNSKGKSLFYGLHVLFSLLILLVHITHEPELIYCILLFFHHFSLSFQTKHNMYSKKEMKKHERQKKNRKRSKYPNALWYSRFTALKSIYTLLHTLFLLFFIFYTVAIASRQAGKASHI